MTGRTHDLAAFTGLSIAFAVLPLQAMTLATLLTAIGFNFIGGLFPDLDQPTAKLWERLRGGTLISRLITPVMGGHRLISHSIVGVVLTGFILEFLLSMLGRVLLVDMTIVWWAFMIGMISHLVIDMFTKEGVPWLFPVPWGFGIPPLKMLRIKTGGVLEKSFIFPGLMIVNAYLFYTHYLKVLDFLRIYVKY